MKHIKLYKEHQIEAEIRNGIVRVLVYAEDGVVYDSMSRLDSDDNYQVIVSTLERTKDKIDDRIIGVERAMDEVFG